MKTKHLILIAFGLICLLFLFGYSVGRKNKDSALNQAELNHSKELLRYNIKLDSITLIVVEKEQEILTQREAIKQGFITKEEMKKLDIKRVNEITKLKARIDTLLHIKPDAKVVYVDTCGENPRPALLLPFSFEKKDKWLSLEGKYNIKGELDVSLKMDVPLSIIGSIDKGTKEYKVSVITENSYIKITDINSSKLDVPRVKKWGIGLAIGYGTSISAPKLSPFIGFGVTRTIIRF